jgi:hypothetical protein
MPVRNSRSRDLKNFAESKTAFDPKTEDGWFY